MPSSSMARQETIGRISRGRSIWETGTLWSRCKGGWVQAYRGREYTAVTATAAGAIARRDPSQTANPGARDPGGVRDRGIQLSADRREV